ncbi:MAG: MFS transporter, partial [Burkholderiales bacterium PBB5]
MRHGRSPSALALAGLLALAVAMGVGRFAFTPMLPLMMRDGLLDAAGGAELAAANYAGYLLGALTAAPLARRWPGDPRSLVLASLLATALLTAAMAASASPLVWLGLRALAGLVSAWALVATTGWVLSALAQAGRSSEGGWVFAGVGSGICTAGQQVWAGAAG